MVLEWYASVSDNPVVTHFAVAPIVDLLTPERFANDSKIQQKANLTKQAWEKYINIPLFCFENCSGNGTSVPTGYFNFGICNCYHQLNENPLDCSIYTPTTTTTPIPVRMKMLNTNRKKKTHVSIT